MLVYGDVISKIQETLKSACSYAKVIVVSSVADYISGAVAQSVFDKDHTILLSVPDGDAEKHTALLAGRFVREYNIEIAVVSKIDPASLSRIMGVAQKKSISDVKSDILGAIEHSNLGGLVDNRAHTNFDAGWVPLRTESKAITIYTTIYTATKTE